MIEVHGRMVSSSAERGIDLVEVISSPRFKQWAERLDSGMVVRHVHVKAADTFGGRIAFIHLRLNVLDPKGGDLVRFLFLRGNSVALLAVFICEGREFVALIVQPREAEGDVECKEVVGGMCDKGSDYPTVAARELQEELGIQVRPEELVDMTERMAKIKRSGLFPSPGACDEAVRFFLFRREVEREELEALQGKATGLAHEGEHLKVRIVPIGDLPHESSNMMAWTAYLLYQHLKVLGRI
ncbi:MAG: NUDIX domain-containing protein [Patescibacteria group bacterium]|nr:NUDIX domain-containing protein [Patescibacteria group bacterium]